MAKRFAVANRSCKRSLWKLSQMKTLPLGRGCD